jgi:hypothetical protein
VKLQQHRQRLADTAGGTDDGDLRDLLDTTAKPRAQQHAARNPRQAHNSALHLTVRRQITRLTAARDEENKRRGAASMVHVGYVRLGLVPTPSRKRVAEIQTCLLWALLTHDRLHMVGCCRSLKRQQREEGTSSI